MGTSTIEAVLNQEADCLLVHAKMGDGYLSFSDVRVDGKKVSSHRYDSVNQRLVIQPMLDEVLKAGSHSLSFAYSAPLPYPSNNVGLYLSRYTSDPDEHGNTHVVNVTATQFEATSARYAMPCLDEPALKANFSVTVDGVPAGYTALGNMPQKSTVANADGTSMVTFDTTPRMSTYLVALVVGPITGTSVNGSNGLNVTAYGMNRASVVGPPSNIQFAAEVGASVTSFYETVFGVKFPLPKQDMIAIPDFAAGAMENWGLVTYRETALLGNTQTSSAAELSRVSIVVAHECVSLCSHCAPCVCLTLPTLLALLLTPSLPQAGAPVVWGHCNDGLVGGAVAERGLRHPHGVHRQPPRQPHLRGGPHLPVGGALPRLPGGRAGGRAAAHLALRGLLARDRGHVQRDIL